MAGLTFVLVVWSIFTHAQGAFKHQTFLWNVAPHNIDAYPQRIWNWREPQFLAGIVPQNRHVFAYAPLNRNLAFNRKEVEPFLITGWSTAEAEIRWTDGDMALLGFLARENAPLGIAMELAPFVTQQHKLQRLYIEVNKTTVASFELSEPGMRSVKFTLETDVLQEKNTVALKLPDAVSPQSLGLSTDRRKLGVALKNMLIVPLLPESESDDA